MVDYPDGKLMKGDFATLVALGCPVLLGAMMWAILKGMRREISDHLQKSNSDNGD